MASRHAAAQPNVAMSSCRLVVVVVVAVVALASSLARADAAHGGIECAACTIVLGLAEQLAELHSQPIDHVIDDLCSYLPSPLSSACQTIINLYGKQIVHDYIFSDIVLEGLTTEVLSRPNGSAFKLRASTNQVQATACTPLKQDDPTASNAG